MSRASVIVVCAIAVIAMLSIHSQRVLPKPIQEFIAESFDPVSHFSGLPAEIQQSLRSKFDPTGSHVAMSGIADANMPFNVSDIVDESLPMRQYIMGGTSSTLAFVLYEHGGVGIHFHFVLYRHESKRWVMVFADRIGNPFSHDVFPRPPSSLDQLKQILGQVELANEKDIEYCW